MLVLDQLIAPGSQANTRSNTLLRKFRHFNLPLHNKSSLTGVNPLHKPKTLSSLMTLYTIRGIPALLWKEKYP